MPAKAETDELSERLGADLRALRRSIGLRQQDVAYRLGIDRSTLSRMEQGKIIIPAPRFIRWLELLGQKVRVVAR